MSDTRAKRSGPGRPIVQDAAAAASMPAQGFDGMHAGELLAVIACEAASVRELLAVAEDEELTPDCRAAALAAASRAAGVIGWMADAACVRLGDTPLKSGAVAWLAPELSPWLVPDPAKTREGDAA